MQLGVKVTTETTPAGLNIIYDSMCDYKEIKRYKGRGSDDLNGALMRHSAIDEAFLNRENDLNSELDELGKCPIEVVFAHDGKTQIRYSILSIWFKNRIGDIIMFPNFLSTSSYVWDSHINNDRTIYKINLNTNSGGKHLFDAVGKNGEDEILFKSKTKFIIDGVGEFIELSEVECEHCDHILYECFYMYDKEIEQLVHPKRKLNQKKSFLEKL